MHPLPMGLSQNYCRFYPPLENNLMFLKTHVLSLRLWMTTVYRTDTYIKSWLWIGKTSRKMQLQTKFLDRDFKYNDGDKCLLWSVTVARIWGLLVLFLRFSAAVICLVSCGHLCSMSFTADCNIKISCNIKSFEICQKRWFILLG